MRISEKRINPLLEKQIINSFVQMIADLRDVKETRTFLQDFFNEIEMEVFVKRMAVAYWLKKGKSYANIKTNLNVSSATIATVQNMLKKEGFKLAIKKMEAEEWANQWAEKIKKFIK